MVERFFVGVGEHGGVVVVAERRPVVVVLVDVDEVVFLETIPCFVEFVDDIGVVVDGTYTVGVEG